MTEPLDALIATFVRRHGGDVDLDRLHELLRHAIGSHPDRDLIVQRMHAGDVPHIRPLDGEQFELRLGPPGGPTVPLGEIDMAHILTRPTG